MSIHFKPKRFSLARGCFAAVFHPSSLGPCRDFCSNLFSVATTLCPSTHCPACPGSRLGAEHKATINLCKLYKRGCWISSSEPWKKFDLRKSAAESRFHRRESHSDKHISLNWRASGIPSSYTYITNELNESFKWPICAFWKDQECDNWRQVTRCLTTAEPKMSRQMLKL